MTLNANTPTTAGYESGIPVNTLTTGLWSAVLLLLVFFLLALPAAAGTIPTGIVAAINLTNFTFAADFEADAFSARDYGIAINDSYLDVNTTYFLTVNITGFTIDAYDFAANSTTATTANPTNFTAKMRNPGTKYNLKVNGAFSSEITTDSYGNATFSYNTWGFNPTTFLLTTCTESWSYSDWSSCSYGYQSRSALDVNSCGTTYNRTETSRACSTAASGGTGGSGGSFSEGTPSLKSLAFSFQVPPMLKILATVLYTLPEPQNITVSYPVTIQLSAPPTPGFVYSFLEIAPSFNTSRYLNVAQIEFKVNKTWYSKNDIVPASTALLRFDGQYWRPLPTVQTGEDSATYSLAANTTSFSLFAIAGTKRPKPTPASTTTLLPTATMTEFPVVPTPATTATSRPISPPPIQLLPSRPPAWALPALLGSILVVLTIYFMKKTPRPAQKPTMIEPGAQVAIKGLVTSYTRYGFECTDGTEFIFVQSDIKPPISSWVEVEGTLSRSGGQAYIAATSVKKLY